MSNQKQFSETEFLFCNFWLDFQFPSNCNRDSIHGSDSAEDTNVEFFLTWYLVETLRTYHRRSSGTSRGTSRHFPGLRRSRPEPGCTAACCSRPGAPPPRCPIPPPPRRFPSAPLHGCRWSARSSWRNRHRRPRWKGGLWQTLWHHRQVLSWRSCCFLAFDKATRAKGGTSFTLGGLKGQSSHFSKVCAKSVKFREVEGFKGSWDWGDWRLEWAGRCFTSFFSTCEAEGKIKKMRLVKSLKKINPKWTAVRLVLVDFILHVANRSKHFVFFPHLSRTWP